MKTYSLTIAGIIAAIGIPLLGEIGFTEVCSQQIFGIGIPFFLSLPGLIAAYIGRLKVGDVTIAGFRK